MARNNEPNWDQLEADVLRKIRLLRAAWEHTESQEPELHAIAKRDLYIPVLKHLAVFCSCVEDEEGPAPDEAGRRKP
jgi:hypothetical protein